ncbi:MAG: RNA-binding S4 domain-containing protein [Lachnospiraceae bacterium]|nr:RNA-binding S4 domain-containing protein [Lachnospiraceae bacterium]
METIYIKDDFIKLGQALKLAGLVESGVDAKLVVQDGLVKVNGEIDTRRGKKLVPGDTFEYEGQTVKVESKLLFK